MQKGATEVELRLEEYARQLAEDHQVIPHSGVQPRPTEALTDYQRVLRSAYERFVERSREQQLLSGAAEWLLDNFYVVQQALRTIRVHFPAGYYERLPKLESGELAGYPRVYAIARALVVSAEGAVDVDRVTRFIDAYQELRQLAMGELWALPILLRLVVIEWLVYALAEREEEEVPSFSPSLRRGSSEGAFDEIEADIVVANCIRSLRALDAYDWKTFFEEVSHVEAALREDPAGVYAALEFETRDRYRKVVEEVARLAAQDEKTVAEEAVALSARQDADASRQRHVGYYLIAEGRRTLEDALDYRPSVGQRLGRWFFDHATFVYLMSITLITLLLVGGFLYYALQRGAGGWQGLAVVLLTLVPASMVAVQLVGWIITQTLPPRELPKLDFSDGIPESFPTFVVVPALLTTEDEVDFLLRQLELHYLSNTDPQLRFALLTDFSDAPEQHMPEDERLLERAVQGIRALNRTHDPENEGCFYLLHRERRWNPREEVWMGWERKRGKLDELNHLLLGESDTTSYATCEGNFETLPEFKFIITLDADTVMPRGAARRLVGTLAHPLNRPRFDERGQVVAGYTVLQPRTEVQPTDAHQSPFSRIYAGSVGLDLYTRAISDVYQDFFGEGIYVGKGIYDLRAFHDSLEGRVPENALLSHDLFEGIHGRAGLVTDIILYESYPPGYLSYIHRTHRWVRGDWQLLPWLLPRVPAAEEGETLPNPLSLLDRWKIVDNLRRSLRQPALLALLIVGWFWLPGSPLFWTLAALLASAFSVVTTFLSRLLRLLTADAREALFTSTRRETARWFFSIVFLPYETLLMGDAIITTLVRLLLSRKRLLQWTTSAHTLRIFGRKSRMALLWQRMGGAVLLPLALAVLMVLFAPGLLAVAGPLLLLWVFSPHIAYLISRPYEREPEMLSDEERRLLHRVARRTWLYFERFVGPEDHWLPPDHFQEQPRGLVAHRTSPTNIGLLLLSTLGAFELGYIGLLDLAVRLRSTLESMEALEHYRGHLLNWYDTRRMSTLEPRYVSTVDSGNLVAALIILKEQLRVLGQRPVLDRARWQGMMDSLDLLLVALSRIEERELAELVAALEAQVEAICERLEEARDEPARRAAVLRDLVTEHGPALNRLLRRLSEEGSRLLSTDLLHDLRLWAERIQLHLDHMRQEKDLLLPWPVLLLEAPEALSASSEESELGERWAALQAVLEPAPSLNRISDVCREAESHTQALLERLQGEEYQAARAWCRDLSEALVSARLAAGSLLIGLQDLSLHAERAADAMPFDFLLDEQRQVFFLGYRVDVEALDRNHYDLLASEARTASLIAIARGEVPQRHWLHLGRPLTRIDGHDALLSWNGSMFEYLMPDLFVRRYPHTLLAESNEAVVERQRAYARQAGVPWGISESAYYRFDAAMNYQYRGFGVPGLGRKRGLGEDLVISPYASLLALGLHPKAVVENVRRLIADGMLGHYGFYDAVDYTRPRLPLGQERAIVRSYMVHHQGMMMAALINYLRENVLVEAFHRDPRMRSIELLLQEQIPSHAPVEETPEEDIGIVRETEEEVTLASWEVPAATALPAPHVLSNGRYNLVITASGGGYSSYVPREAEEETPIALTRWRADTTLDAWGMWIYVQDLDAGTTWSVTRQPMGERGDELSVRFHPHQAEFARRDHDLAARLLVTVAPESMAEVRRLTLTNQSDRSRRLRLTSYTEPVLAPQATDARHPAFNKLFMESEYLEATNVLFVRRRPRKAGETPFYLGQLIATEGKIDLARAYESDRARFVGRGRSPARPIALENEAWLTGSSGATLDPILALGLELELEPHSSVAVAWVTLVAEERAELVAVAQHFTGWPAVMRTFEQARARSEAELRDMAAGSADVERFGRLLAPLLYPHPRLRAAPETLASSRKGQSALWPHAISGDYPILLVRVGEREETALIREVLQAHAYWRVRRLRIDLVLLNTKDAGYAQELADQIHSLIVRNGSQEWINRRGGIFVLRQEQLDQETLTLLETVARVILDGSRGALESQLADIWQLPTYLPAFAPAGRAFEAPEPEPVTRPAELHFDNGFGGFTSDGKEYVIYLEGDRRRPEHWTPAPWINVIANPEFGFLVSEAGLGYTWAANSGENRLTPWRNDPVSDPPAEALYLRDEETGERWTPTPLPRGAALPYLVRHGWGYSEFEHHSHGLNQQLRLFATLDAPIKVVRLRLENTWDHPRRITATYYAEWVLATFREEAQLHVVPEYDGEREVLLARNTYNTEFGERIAFLAANRPLHGLTTDRAEFLGREGGLEDPAALHRVGLSGRVAAGVDPCAAFQVHVDLEPHGVEEITFFLGQGANREESLALVERLREEDAVVEMEQEVTSFWKEFLGTLEVETPEPSMDLILPWLLYQALSSRIWGRSALYQSSGAYGFRDQLQDVMTLLHARPGLARGHILRAARHQFEAGDVLHWWHPPSGRGVRTRITDDLLWLPFVTAEYIEKTGDTAILDEQVPFRKGEPLEPDEEERYANYALTDESASIYEHCLRAIERGSTEGPHGLPRMGGGDWNDGMNRVGIEGEGESIWLGWFLHAVLERFAPLCETRGDEERAETFRTRARRLQESVERFGWDGAWYLRAFYDDGTPLGSAESEECRIDSLGQSWAVLTGAGREERIVEALASAEEHLISEEEGLIRLFTPPFDETPKDPGYIKGYPPGVRENGGQYTHAALWLVWAFAERGEGERAEALFRLLNPLRHAETREDAQRYRVEPYVVAADVYGAEPHTGRGGWTWYTGSSGWMYRLGVEAILGLRREGEALRIDPRIPPAWPGFRARYRFGESVYEIEVDNASGAGKGVAKLTLDGEALGEGRVPLEDDGAKHVVRVLLEKEE